MAAEATRYIVYDTESVVDGAFLARVRFPEDALDPEEAVERARREQLAEGKSDFIPVTFHVPVAIGVARVGADFRLQELKSLDAPRYDPAEMVSLFWRGVEVYRSASLVDFNGRGFDIPLLTLAAFRFGLGCAPYFGTADRSGYRYRFGEKHLDLLDWLTEYGACRLHGGLDALAKMLGKPGKMETRGAQVDALYREGKLQEINDYCLHDVLDTYFVFLRTRVLTGELTLEREQEIVSASREWLTARAEEQPSLNRYLESFGAWDPTPFR